MDFRSGASDSSSDSSTGATSTGGATTRGAGGAKRSTSDFGLTAAARAAALGRPICVVANWIWLPVRVSDSADNIVANLDVTVVLERPKIKDHIDAMRAAVAAAIGVDAARVSIKGKTNEGVDAIGRGEAIAAHAIVLIRAV